MVSIKQVGKLWKVEGLGRTMVFAFEYQARQEFLIRCAKALRVEVAR